MSKIRSCKGFTLIELLVVCLILAVLAAIIIPQLVSSTETAQEASVKTSLDGMRAAIQLYKAQHPGRYPGQYTMAATPVPVTSDAEAASSFVAQLTNYTDAYGHTVDAKDATHIYGPYIDDGGLEINPYTGTNTLLADFDETSLAGCVSLDMSTAWKYCPQLGRIYSNADLGHQGW